MLACYIHSCRANHVWQTRLADAWPLPGRQHSAHPRSSSKRWRLFTARFSATAIANCHRVSSATTIQGHPLQSRQMPTRRATKGVVIRRQQHLKYVSCHCERSKKCCGRRGCGDVKGCCRRYVVMWLIYRANLWIERTDGRTNGRTDGNAKCSVVICCWCVWKPATNSLQWHLIAWLPDCQGCHGYVEGGGGVGKWRSCTVAGSWHDLHAKL